MSVKRKPKSGRWIVFAVIVIIAVSAAVVKMRPAQAYKNVTAKIGDITTYYSFSGNVDTKNRQTVIANKVMQISKINVKEGDAVKTGDVLLKTTAGEKITSKITGEVGNLNVEENQQVMAGTQLMEIVDYNNLIVSVKVDEYDISALQAGEETTVNIGALNKQFNGKVSSIAREGQIQNGVTFFPATINLEKNENIRIGMSAEAKVLSGKAAGVVTLPMSVVQFDESNHPYVFTKNKRGRLVKTGITTGINNGTAVEVKSGISGEEEIFYPKADATAFFGIPKGGTSKGAGKSSGKSSNSGGK